MKSNAEQLAVRMRTNTENVAIRAWRQQLDNAIRVAGTVTEGSMRMGALHMRAATEANEMVDQARKLLEGAGNPLELWRIQSDWLALTLDRSVNYLNEFNQAAADTQTELTKFWYEPGSTFSNQASALPQASKTAFALMDDAYSRWRETTIQLWETAVENPVLQGAQGRQPRETRESSNAAAKQAKQET
jgi:hypothetical protein